MTRRSWLALLALALMAPAALASAPRGASPTLPLDVREPALAPLEPAPAALVLEQALVGEEHPGFPLGLESLDAPRQRLAPLEGAQLLDEDLAAQLARTGDAEEPRYPETRIGGLRLFGQDLVVVSTPVSVDVRWGCADFGCGIAEGIGSWLSEDPAGTLDSPSLYAFVGNRPNLATDPLGTCGWWNDRPCVDDLTFAGDIALGYAEGMLLHPIRNAQRAAGGAAGVVNLAFKTASEPHKASYDFWAGVAGNDAAAQRTMDRVAGVKGLVTNPIGTLIGSHEAAFARIETHEAAGQYFSSGMVGGELGASDALLAYGGAQAATGVARAVSSGRVGFLLEEAGVTTPKTRWQVGRSIVMKTAKGKPPAFSTVQKRFWKNQGKTSAPQRVNPVTGDVESMELSHRFVPQRFTLVPPNLRNAGFNLEPLWPEEHAAVDWYRWQTLDPQLKPLVPRPPKPPL